MSKEGSFRLIDELESSNIVDEEEFLDLIGLFKQESPIHGIGIFTKTKIRENKLFYIIPLNDVRSTPSPKCAKIAEKMFVSDPKILNWVNHSCVPNSELVFQENKVFLRAKRDILPGEEITVDYCETEEKNNLVFCNCGSSKCRNYFYYS